MNNQISDSNIELVKSFRVGQPQVKVRCNRVDLGIASGQNITRKIKELLSKQKEIGIVFASAPSQKDTIRFLRTIADIELLIKDHFSSGFKLMMIRAKVISLAEKKEGFVLIYNIIRLYPKVWKELATGQLKYLIQ